jgi:ribose transport system permease protein
MKRILSWIRKLFSPEYILLWMLLILIVFFSIKSPTFRTTANLLEVLRSSGINAILVLGLTWIVASGEFDVAFPDIAALSSMVLVYLVTQGIAWGYAILLAILVSCLFGLLSGVLVNVFKFRALIATIGVSVLAKSTAYIIGKGSPIYLININKSVERIMFGRIANLIPILAVIVLVMYLAANFLQNQTKLGQYLYALGENREASYEAGIPKKMIFYSFFVLSAALAAGGGVLLATSFSAGQPNFAGTLFIDGLTAVFLGALMIKPGKPNVIGTYFGAIFIMVLGNGLTLLNIPFYYGLIIKGFLMVLGVTVVAFSGTDFFEKRRAKRAEEPALQ